MDEQHKTGSRPAAYRYSPEVEDGAAEVADMLRVDLAEVAEVVVPHKMPHRLLHGRQVQVPPVHNKVLVLSMDCTEPGQEYISRNRQTSRCIHKTICPD